ncbi:oxidoreductase [Streptomyces halobius]|uniref:Oxidoreductase n=1 Tax=Streptomyces halobius TaxID=2879846 RepID=A0ABY4M609_9ACTN|nr:oxidoreductase [Streptomyces halobius]UQA91810.1 oxidoreductase [Streptomyces halobius]
MSAEPAEYATFGLAPAMRPGGVLPTGAYETHRDFLDFSINGKPLLLRLADLDAVSPLAADLGPSLFAAQVRRLLLEDAGPVPDSGRRVIYGCPECEGPACGAVTAVVERDGADFVWRDFAWQTDDTVDLRRNGYTGIGPFRFEGAQYRAALEQLLASGAEGPARPALRVLLIGRRAAALTKLAAALRGTGIGAEITRDVADAAPDELRSYGAVALGRGMGETGRAAVRQAFADAGSTAVLVDGLAPIVPLAVAQIEQALDRCPQDERRLLRLDTERGTAVLTVATPCRVRLTGYRLDRLCRTRTTELFDGQLEAGRHVFGLKGMTGEGYVVARTTGGVRCVRLEPT